MYVLSHVLSDHRAGRACVPEGSIAAMSRFMGLGGRRSAHG